MHRSTTFLQAGDKMPPLTLPTLTGASVDLQSLQGKKYILFMWASW
ncbi:MAG: redoxin family protein [Caldilineaceae bacterium]